jgi:bacteriorhodopsin
MHHACSCLLLQASHGGDDYIPLYWDLTGARDVFYARYIDWFVTVSHSSSPGTC